MLNILILAVIVQTTNPFQIITESGPYANLSAEEIYQAKRNVFFSLRRDTTIMYQGVPTDLILQQFYDSTLYTNMGLLDLVNELIFDSSNFVAGVIN